MNKSTADINPVLLEWMFAREVMRRFGFTPDEIFFEVYPSGKIVNDDGTVEDLGMPAIAVKIDRAGRSFCWPIGGVDMPDDELKAAYESLCALWNADRLSLTHGDFLASRPARMAMQVMAALGRKGFRIPATEAAVPR